MIMKRMLGTISSFLLSCLFVGIVFFLILGVLDVDKSDSYTAVLVFTIIESAILLLVVGLGKTISNAIGVGMYAPLCASTVFYVAVTTTINCLLFDELSKTTFILINLAIVFVFLCFALPLIAKGANSGDGQPPVDPMNPHNLPDLTPRYPTNNIDLNNKGDNQQ